MKTNNITINSLKDNINVLNKSNNMDFEDEFEKIIDLRLSKSYILTEEDKNEIYNTIKRDDFPNMRLIDLIELKKKYSDLLNELENSKEEIKSYFLIKNQIENISKFINNKDLLEDLSLETFNEEDEMSEKFINEYPKQHATLTFLLDTILTYIDDNFKEQTKSVKFILDELIYSLNKSISKLNLKKDELTQKEYNSKLKMYNTSLLALKNKNNIDYIKSKFNYNNKSFITFIKKNQKFDSERIKRSIRIADKNISDKQLLFIIKYLTERYNDEKFAITLVDYCVNMLKSGISSGYTTYWKIFLLNLSFISMGNFDLDIKSNDYLRNIDELYEEYKKVI